MRACVFVCVRVFVRTCSSFNKFTLKSRAKQSRAEDRQTRKRRETIVFVPIQHRLSSFCNYSSKSIKQQKHKSSVQYMLHQKAKHRETRKEKERKKDRERLQKEKKINEVHDSVVCVVFCNTNSYRAFYSPSPLYHAY